MLSKIPNEVSRKLSNVSAFFDKAKQYTEINELTAKILHLFIEQAGEQNTLRESIEVA